jgi:hypothetical protein
MCTYVHGHAYSITTKEPPMLDRGDPAPDFTRRTVHDETITLSDYRGAPLVLIFLRHLG